eukprot:EG_transcript_3425
MLTTPEGAFCLPHRYGRLLYITLVLTLVTVFGLYSTSHIPIVASFGLLHLPSALRQPSLLRSTQRPLTEYERVSVPLPSRDDEFEPRRAAWADTFTALESQRSTPSRSHSRADWTSNVGFREEVAASQPLPPPAPSGGSRRSFLKAVLTSSAGLTAWGGQAGRAEAITLPEDSEFLRELRNLTSYKPNKVQSKYSPGFVVYLTGYLINYDPAFRKHWRHQRTTLRYQYTPLVKSFYLQITYRQLARELEACIVNVKAKHLTALLWRLYSGASIEMLHQLRILFSFMSKENQPRDLITEGLEMELRYYNKTVEDLKGEYLYSLREEVVVNPESVVVALIDDFKPPKLLPNDLCPKFDESKKKWVVPDPGLQRGATFTASALRDNPLSTNHLGFNYYTLFILALAGGVASSVTHSLIQPIDVNKTKRAMALLPNSGFYTTAILVHSQDGFVPIVQRNLAQFVGRLLYGATIYPCFELTKLYFAEKVGVVMAVDYRFGFVLLASFLASLLGLLFLVPFEAVKQRLIADPGYAATVPGAFRRLLCEEGLEAMYSRYTYRVVRVATFNAAKFIVFDYFNDLVVLVLPTLLPGTETIRAALAVVKGCVAGLLGVFASQPIDVIQTRAKASGATPEDPKVGLFGAACQVVRERGWAGLFAGAEYRLIWAMASISTSFFLYDGTKELLVKLF